MKKYILALLLLVTVALAAGCEQRVVRQKRYYPGQFSHVTPAEAPTAAPPQREQTDILQDTWRGLSNLFKSSDSNQSRQVLTADDLKNMQEQQQN